MNNIRAHKTKDKSHRVILLLVVALAALSSAMKELNQLQTLTVEAGELIAQWSDVVVPTANARTESPVESCSFVPVTQNRSDEFRWSGNIAQGAAIEIKGINGNIAAEQGGNEVEVVARKRARRSDIDSVQIKVVPHAGGVTICAVYPTDDDSKPNTCEPGEGKGRNSVRNNDVNVDFTVRVPYRVGFIGRTINGEISATSLTGNVEAKTINGSIKISTSGYAEATTINGGIVAKVGDAAWPTSLTFSTLNGEISLDLPSNASADVEAQTLNGSIHSDFPLSVTNLEGQKRVKGKIGVGGRGLHLKTLNGSINLRSAG